MSTPSDPAQSVTPILKAMVEIAKDSGKALLPKNLMHHILVVTPQQVLDRLRNGGVTVSFEDCLGDPTYFLKVEWDGNMTRLSKYEREEWTSTYGPCSWDLDAGEHPF